MTGRLVRLPADSELTIDVIDAEDARRKLIPHICGDCLHGLVTPAQSGRPVQIRGSLDDLLGTGCGLEWAYYPAEGVAA